MITACASQHQIVKMNASAEMSNPSIAFVRRYVAPEFAVCVHIGKA